MMKTKYLFIYICLILLTAPIGVVKGQDNLEGYKLYSNLLKGPNKFRSLLKDTLGINPDDIKKQLANFEYALNAAYNKGLDSADKDYLDKVKETYNKEFNNITGTDQEACHAFIKVYLNLNFDQFLDEVNNLPKDIQEDTENEDGDEIIIDPNHPGDAIKMLKDQIALINKKISEQEKKDDASKEGNFNDIVYISALIILFIMMLILYLKYRKLNNDLKEKASKSALESNIRIITEKYNNLNPQINIHTVEKKRVSEIKTVPPTPTPQVVAQPINSTAAPQTNNERIYYVTVDASENDKLWKETSVRTDQHLYEIHLENPDSIEGELRICPNIKAEFEMKFIGERQSYFKFCEVHSNGSSPTRIELKKAGRVVKSGSAWRVTVPPMVELK